MATSIVYTGNGSTTDFSFSFDYLAQSHVKVYLDGVLQSSGYSFQSSSIIRFSSAPASGVSVTISRETPVDRLVDYEEGAILSEYDLDTDSKQALYIAEERQSDHSLSLRRAAHEEKFNAESRVVQNVADAVSDNDAVAKAFMEGRTVHRTTSSGNFSAQGKRITNGSVPIDDTDFATKSYVAGVFASVESGTFEDWGSLADPADVTEDWGTLS